MFQNIILMTLARALQGWHHPIHKNTPGLLALYLQDTVLVTYLQCFCIVLQSWRKLGICTHVGNSCCIPMDAIGFDPWPTFSTPAPCRVAGSTGWCCMDIELTGVYIVVITCYYCGSEAYWSSDQQSFGKFHVGMEPPLWFTLRTWPKKSSRLSWVDVSWISGKPTTVRLSSLNDTFTGVIWTSGSISSGYALFTLQSFAMAHFFIDDSHDFTLPLIMIFHR